MNSEKLLIVGCGDLGQRLARDLQHLPYQVAGVRRKAPADNPAAVDYRLHDVETPGVLATLVQEKFAVIVITMTPTVPGAEGYRRAYVETCRTLVDNLQVHHCRPRLLVFVSSSRVYGQNDGNEVDETSPTLPLDYAGQYLLEAEQLIRNSGFAHCIVRFSGIYGPGRQRLLQQVREASVISHPGYTNRIHIDDCAAVLAHLIERHRQGQDLASIYIASDNAPTPQAEVVAWLAEQLNVLLPNPAELDTSSPLNKRCSNRRLLATGFRFRYPNYRAGYGAMLTQG